MTASAAVRDDRARVAQTPAGMARYLRQLPIDGIGAAGQQRLLDATVLVAGVGGLGGTVATHLAAAGVGRLLLTHEGPLELPDLNRQTLMSPDWLGHSRVACARAALHRFNPDVDVTAMDARLTDANALALVAQAQVAVSCRLNFEEREVLNRACVALGVPMVEAAMWGMECTLTTIVPGQTPCLKCIFPAFPDWDPLGFPVLGAVPGALGSLAAAEVVKVITGMGTPLAGTLLHGDMGEMTFRRIRIRRRADCPACGAPTRGDE